MEKYKKTEDYLNKDGWDIESEDGCLHWEDNLTIHFECNEVKLKDFYDIMIGYANQRVIEELGSLINLRYETKNTILHDPYISTEKIMNRIEELEKGLKQ